MGVAASLSTFRPPAFPAELFYFLAAASPARELAWDCATGRGETALCLTSFFRRVVASDASEEHVRGAVSHERISYRVERAEETALPPSSVDLITVAQALHWLELDPFYAAAQRVLRPGGVIAAWCYGRHTISPDFDAACRAFSEQVAPYWPPEHRLVEQGYRTLPFPFAPIASPALDLSVRWRLDELLAYFRTWTATRRFVTETGCDPVEGLAAALTTAWGPPERQRLVRWPLSLLVGRRVSSPRAGASRRGGRAARRRDRPPAPRRSPPA